MKVLSITLFLFLLTTQICVSQWYQQNSGSANSLRGVFFTSQNTGFAVGGLGTILKTLDRGANWLPQNSGTYNFFTSVFFSDENTGWVCGQNGIIEKTTDGGLSWIAQSSGTDNTLQSIYFVNSTYGWAAGDTGTVVITNDGGSNWSAQTNLIQDDLLSIYFTDTNNGFTVGDAGWVLLTNNGGTTWTTTQVGPWWLHTVYFTNSSTGYAAGYSGTILKTENAGSNWAPYSTDTTAGFLEVFFINNNYGWAVGENGIIYNTLNAGQSWELESSGTSKSLFSVYFTDMNTGWAVGNDGTILKYGDVILETSAFKNNLNLPISDLDTTRDVILINIQNYNYLSKTLVGGKIFLDTVFHSADGDLEFTLSHNGVLDTIIYKVGGSGDNFINCVLDDAAFIPIENGDPPFTGVFKPSFPLSKFGGLDPNGEWTLSIYDGNTGNTGTLEAWGIELIFANTTDADEFIINYPDKFILQQNYPNPFNPSTKISWQSPVGSWQTLKIYDLLGREVATLIDEYKPAGTYEVEFDAKELTSGIYFYKMQANEFIKSKKMILIK
jgi:photosystem II stability/assembly factor-like uncharacterized protein